MWNELTPTKLQNVVNCHRILIGWYCCADLILESAASNVVSSIKRSGARTHMESSRDSFSNTATPMVQWFSSVFSTYFALIELNPFIPARSEASYRKGGGWKFSINGSLVHLPDNLFSLCLRIRARISRAFPSAGIRLKSLCVYLFFHCPCFFSLWTTATKCVWRGGSSGKMWIASKSSAVHVRSYLGKKYQTWIAWLFPNFETVQYNCRTFHWNSRGCKIWTKILIKKILNIYIASGERNIIEPVSKKNVTSDDIHEESVRTCIKVSEIVLHFTCSRITRPPFSRSGARNHTSHAWQTLFVFKLCRSLRECMGMRQLLSRFSSPKPFVFLSSMETLPDRIRWNNMKLQLLFTCHDNDIRRVLKRSKWKIRILKNIKYRKSKKLSIDIFYAKSLKFIKNRRLKSIQFLRKIRNSTFCLFW